MLFSVSHFHTVALPTKCSSYFCFILLQISCYCMFLSQSKRKELKKQNPRTNYFASCFHLRTCVNGLKCLPPSPKMMTKSHEISTLKEEVRENPHSLSHQRHPEKALPLDRASVSTLTRGLALSEDHFSVILRAPLVACCYHSQNSPGLDTERQLPAGRSTDASLCSSE